MIPTYLNRINIVDNGFVFKIIGTFLIGTRKNSTILYYL